MIASLKRFKTSPFFRYGNNECHICGGKDKGCMIHEDGNTVVCTRQSFGAYKEYEWPNMGWVYFHKIDGSEQVDKSKFKPVEQQETQRLAATKTLHTQYAHLKKKYPLLPEYKEYLAREGILDTSRWSTIPRSPKGHIELQGEFPQGIPGIYHKNGKAYLNTWFYGMVCWQYNAEGLITGGEIRLSEECKQERGIDKEGSVYRPLVSSAEWQGGTAPDEFTSVWINHESDEVWITEGFKKGQILYENYGVNVIAMRGVGNYARTVQGLAGLIARVKKLRKVVVAFDADKDTNPAVKRANESLVQLMVDQQVLEVYEAFWDKSEKGVDDAINADLQIEKRPLNNAVYMELEQGRKILAETYEKMLREDTPVFNLLKVSAGVGKTWALIQALNQLDKTGWLLKTDDKGNKSFKRIAFVFDNNTLVQEMLPLFEFDVIALEGRNESEESLFYCASKGTIDQIAAAGLNTQKYGCVKCTLRSWCVENAYLGTVEMLMEQKFILTNKAAILNRSQRINDIDILIMDEGIRQNIQEEITANFSDVVLYEMALTAAITDYDNEIDNLEGFDKQTDKRKNRIIELKEMKVNAQSQIKYLEELKDLMEFHVPGKTTQIYPQFANLELPGFILMDSEGCVFDGTDDGFGQRKVWIKPLFSSYPKATWLMPDGSLYMKSVNMKIVQRMNEMIVLNLDATPIDSYLKLFDNVRVTELPVQDHVQVQSILDKKYTKGQLENNPSYVTELVDTCKTLYKKHKGNIAYLASKAMAEVLITDGIPDWCVGWYGKDTRGSNKWQGVEAVVTVGPYIENLDAVERDIIVLKNAGVEVERDVLLKQITSAETIQAIARGRGVSRTKENPLIVYKLSSLKIEGVKEDITFANVYDLLDGVTASERSRRSPQEIREARKKALDLVYQKPVAHAQSEGQKTGPEKHVSNPMIAGNDTPSASQYNKYYSEGEWGVIFANLSQQPIEYLTTLSDSLRMNWATIQNVSKKIWDRFVNVITEGISSISDQMKYLDASKSTVMRLRKALIHLIAPLFNDCAPETQKEEEEQIADYAIENHFEELVLTARNSTPDKNLYSHAKAHRLMALEEIQQALDMVEKSSDPVDHDNAVAWYWMCAFNQMKSKLSHFLCRQRTDIVLQYFLSTIDKEEHNEKIRAS